MSGALIPVRFCKAHGLYNAGEVAGFSADKVLELEQLKVIDPVEDVAEAEPEPALSSVFGSDKFGPVIDLGGGQTVILGDVVRDAVAATGLSDEDWNALEQPWRDAAIETAIEQRRGAAVASAVTSTPAKSPAAAKPSGKAKPAAQQN